MQQQDIFNKILQLKGLVDQRIQSIDQQDTNGNPNASLQVEVNLWRHMCEELQKEVQVKPNELLTLKEVESRYSLQSQEFEKLFKQQCLLSHENELLLFEVDQLRVENLKLVSAQGNAEKKNAEIEELLTENKNLQKQLSLMEEGQNNQKIQYEQLQLKLVAAQKNVKVEYRGDEDWQKRLEQFKREHLKITEEEMNEERDNWKSREYELLQETETLHVQISKEQHEKLVLKKQFDHEVEVLKTELLLKGQRLQEEHEAKMQLEKQLRDCQGDCKKLQDQLHSHQKEHHHNVSHLQHQVHENDKHGHFKEQVLLKENQILKQKITRLESNFNEQLKVQEERVRVELQRQHEAELRLQLREQEGRSSLISLKEEISRLQQRVDHLVREKEELLHSLQESEKRHQSDVLRVKKDAELWKINSQETEKEKQEFENKLKEQEVMLTEEIQRLVEELRDRDDRIKQLSTN